MKWITRERPKIDRIACPWLITRFIDKTPEFLFVPSGDVMTRAKRDDAIPYDVPGVELTHVGAKCSFDAFIAKYGLKDRALDQLAIIVRGADTGRPDLAPQAAPVRRGQAQPVGRAARVVASRWCPGRALPTVKPSTRRTTPSGARS